MGLRESRLNMKRKRTESANRIDDDNKVSQNQPKDNREVDPSTFGGACELLGITSISDDSYSSEASRAIQQKKKVMRYIIFCIEKWKAVSSFARTGAKYIKEGGLTQPHCPSQNEDH